MRRVFVLFAAVGAVMDGDEVIFVSEVVVISLFFYFVPGLRSRAKGFFDRDHVINVEVVGVGVDLSGVEVIPFPFFDFAFFVGFEGDFDQAFFDENFLSGVLAVPIRVDPRAEIISLIILGKARALPRIVTVIRFLFTIVVTSVFVGTSIVGVAQASDE